MSTFLAPELEEECAREGDACNVRTITERLDLAQLDELEALTKEDGLTGVGKVRVRVDEHLARLVKDPGRVALALGDVVGMIFISKKGAFRAVAGAANGVTFLFPKRL